MVQHVFWWNSLLCLCLINHKGSSHMPYYHKEFFFLLQTNILKTIAFMLLWRYQYQHLGYLMQCPTWSYQIQKCTNILSLTQSPINNWSIFFSNRRKILIPVYCYIKKIIFLKKKKNVGINFLYNENHFTLLILNNGYNQKLQNILKHFIIQSYAQEIRWQG